jgi:hypothetical protein
MTFEEWWKIRCRDVDMPVYGDLELAKAGWDAALSTVAPQEEPEPTPTEMVKRLIDKGWDFTHDLKIVDPTGGFPFVEVAPAYRKAFPRKVRKEMEVWMHEKCGTIYRRKNVGDEYGNPSTEEDLLRLGWTQGTAVFYVEEDFQSVL